MTRASGRKAAVATEVMDDDVQFLPKVLKHLFSPAFPGCVSMDVCIIYLREQK